MPIQFTCSCGKKLSVPDTSAGKLVKCPGCHAVTRVPDTAAGEPAPVAATKPVKRPRAGADDLAQDRPDKLKTPKKTGCGMVLVLLAVGLVLLISIGAALIGGFFYLDLHKPFVTDAGPKGAPKDDDDNVLLVKKINESDPPLREFADSSNGYKLLMPGRMVDEERRTPGNLHGCRCSRAGTKRSCSRWVT